MKKLIINGEEKTLNAETLRDVLRAENVPQDYWNSLALARAGSVVPRAAWENTMLNDGDRIEIVMPFAGG